MIEFFWRKPKPTLYETYVSNDYHRFFIFYSLQHRLHSLMPNKWTENRGGPPCASKLILLRRWCFAWFYAVAAPTAGVGRVFKAGCVVLCVVGGPTHTGSAPTPTIANKTSFMGSFFIGLGHISKHENCLPQKIMSAHCHYQIERLTYKLYLQELVAPTK